MTVDQDIQRAVVGWIIPIQHIVTISTAGKEAAERGEDVTAAVQRACEAVGATRS